MTFEVKRNSKKPKMPDPENDIVVSLHSALGKLSHELKNMDLPPGMTPERLRSLTSIQLHEPISVKSLAAIEKVRPASMSRMISSLETNGLVRRQVDTEDGRGVLVSLTVKGRRAYLRANQLCLKQLADALNQLHPDQVRMLRDIASTLEQLTSALDS